jgi:hypothetical protein
LAAVDDVPALQGGLLANSSLSMTPRDCFALWEEISKIYPATAAAPASPYNFFGADERITLQRTKDYEDHLKKQLAVLAHSHPVETHELLYNFRLEEPEKDFDMCDLILNLKDRDMLPCLVFHLNAFEAIKLFQVRNVLPSVPLARTARRYATTHTPPPPFRTPRFGLWGSRCWPVWSTGRRSRTPPTTWTRSPRRRRCARPTRRRFVCRPCALCEPF